MQALVSCSAVPFVFSHAKCSWIDYDINVPMNVFAMCTLQSDLAQVKSELDVIKVSWCLISQSENTGIIHGRRLLWQRTLKFLHFSVTYSIFPSRDDTELIFTFPCTLLSGNKFKNYSISNNGKPTTNYKSIHFIINGKDFNEEEFSTSRPFALLPFYFALHWGGSRLHGFSLGSGIALCNGNEWMTRLIFPMLLGSGCNWIYLNFSWVVGQ